LYSSCSGNNAAEKIRRQEETDPAALSCDPASKLLFDEELNNELDEMSEDDVKTKALFHGCDDDTVAKTQEHNDTTPVDETVAE